MILISQDQENTIPVLELAVLVIRILWVLISIIL